MLRNLPPDTVCNKHPTREINSPHTRIGESSRRSRPGDTMFARREPPGHSQSARSISELRHGHVRSVRPDRGRDADLGALLENAAMVGTGVHEEGGDIRERREMVCRGLAWTCVHRRLTVLASLPHSHLHSPPGRGTGTGARVRGRVFSPRSDALPALFSGKSHTPRAVPCASP